MIPGGDRFECELEGQRLIGHVMDAAGDDGQPAVLLWMGDESGASVGPPVRARFSIVEMVLTEPSMALLRRRAVEQFRNMGWPARLAELARKGITATQEMNVTK
jgi:hypothetical protein